MCNNMADENIDAKPKVNLKSDNGNQCVITHMIHRWFSDWLRIPHQYFHQHMRLKILNAILFHIWYLSNCKYTICTLPVTFFILQLVADNMLNSCSITLSSETLRNNLGIPVGLVDSNLFLLWTLCLVEFPSVSIPNISVTFAHNIRYVYFRFYLFFWFRIWERYLYRSPFYHFYH